VAQATIQALQTRVTELSEVSEDSASPAAADDVGAIAELQDLRVKLKQAQDKLAVVSSASSSAAKAMQAVIADLQTQLKLLTQERDKLKNAATSRPTTPISRPTTPNSSARKHTPSSRSVASSRSGMVGIGMVITDSAPHRVTSVVPGGAAHACGQMREGDTLVSVDGSAVESLNVSGVRNLLLGEPGSKVDLTLARAAPDDDETVEYKVGVIRGVQASKPRFI